MTEQDERVFCNIKPPNYLSIGTTTFHSGCAVIEVTFPNTNPVDISKITFVNNYTAYLGVKFKVADPSTGNEEVRWKTGIKKYRLMPNAHCETQSQSYFSLYENDFKFPPKSVSAIRFILYQPSPSWKTFTIEELYIFKRGTVSEQGVAENIEISENEPSTDSEIISQQLMEMLNLTAKVEEVSPTVEIGRFDIDGCYELNLLSYN